jgi:hypothetical protein
MGLIRLMEHIGPIGPIRRINPIDRVYPRIVFLLTANR